MQKATFMVHLQKLDRQHPMLSAACRGDHRDGSPIACNRACSGSAPFRAAGTLACYLPPLQPVFRTQGWKGNITHHEGISPVAYATACSGAAPLRAADTPRAPCPAIAPCLAQSEACALSGTCTRGAFGLPSHLQTEAPLSEGCALVALRRCFQKRGHSLQQR